MLAACHSQAIDCLYLLVDANDHKTISLAQVNGFDFVDIRLTMVGPACERQPPPAPNVSYRLGRESDLPSLLPIASASHRLSRFYADARFGRRKADSMYEIWLEKSMAGEMADAVVVAEFAGESVGYLTCMVDRPIAAEGNMGLAGIAGAARGQGIGIGIFQYALAWFQQQGLERVNVVTQGSNVVAQRIYQRLGFKTRSVELWFHKWFDERG